MGERIAHRGRETAETEQHDGREQDRPPADAVGERGDEERAKQQAERPGRKEKAQIARRETPILPQRRRDIAGELEIGRAHV